ncbi:MAG: hypothetical protein ABIP61_17160 [Burkholderiaceae bacterium]
MTRHPAIPCGDREADPVDLATPVHKALHRFMFDVLVQIGALDVSSTAEIRRGVNAVERLLALLPNAPAAPRNTARALRQAAASQRRTLAARLYRELTSLVTWQLQQQPRAATRWPAPEAAALRRRQLARLSADELRAAMHWMGAALTPQELAALLDDLHASVDTVRFHGVLDTLARELDAPRWQRVAGALDQRAWSAPDMARRIDSHGPPKRRAMAPWGAAAAGPDRNTANPC